MKRAAHPGEEGANADNAHGHDESGATMKHVRIDGDASGAHDATTLTDEEAKVYDRQLRLWGVEAQRRMKTSSVLMLGDLNGVTAEIAKNIILAGVGSFTVCDDTTVTQQHIGCNFALSQDALGKPRAAATVEFLQALNPLTRVGSIPVPEAGFAALPFAQYDVVISCGLSLPQHLAVSKSVQSASKRPMLFYVNMIGLNGLWIEDLGPNFEYRKVAQSQVSAGHGHGQSHGMTTAHYLPLEELLHPFVSEAGEVDLALLEKTIDAAVPARPADVRNAYHCFAQLLSKLSVAPERRAGTDLEHLRGRPSSFITEASMAAHGCVQPLMMDSSLINFEFPAVSAVLGGVVAQEVLKVLARQGEPFACAGVTEGLLARTTVLDIAKLTEHASGRATNQGSQEDDDAIEL